MAKGSTDIDRVVLLKLKEGQSSAFELLFWKYNAKLYNFVYNILYDKSLAEDITQSAFLKIWERREDIDPDKSFSAYLFVIARNLVFKETERLIHEGNYIMASKEQEGNTETDNQTSEKLDATFVEQYIDKIIEQLPPSRREIFILSRKNGFSNKEIAQRLAISEKTVETQIYRSLQFLKERMKGHIVILSLFFLSQNI
ncbi:MAG: RNA polymerase sigma-70 factor [Dysgonomonas sp.]|nr:RNA polymerase sigma-70 factor [Dysgonomonas sp.]